MFHVKQDGGDNAVCQMGLPPFVRRGDGVNASEKSYNGTAVILAFTELRLSISMWGGDSPWKHSMFHVKQRQSLRSYSYSKLSVTR